MDTLRKPYIGVWNIVRFNWHFYLFALLFIASLLVVMNFMSSLWQAFILILICGIIISVLITLLVSHWIYDRSNLYDFNLLSLLKKPIYKIINIHAGLDESSSILQNKFPKATFKIYDFYDPNLHTEVSIKRARKFYPPLPGTQSINTMSPPENSNVDLICLILAAHEIRNDTERIDFFKSLAKSLSKDGSIYLVEHLRDLPNFIAFNIGFFHFMTKAKWLETFKLAGLEIKYKKKTTPFVHQIILQKHGNTP